MSSLNPSSAFPVVAYPSSIAGNCHGTELAANHLQKSDYFVEKKSLFEWTHLPEIAKHSETASGRSALTEVAKRCQAMAQHISELPHQSPILAIGGDHSMGIGTWSGIAARCGGDLGLIWIDAHMDSHTPDTSASQNIHGMPVAALLGHGDPSLTQILHPEAKLKAQNLCFIGVRDYEPEEKVFLDQLNVRYFTIDEVQASNLETVLQQAIAHVSAHSQHLGISIDLDSLDPADAPGVSLPVPNGLRSADLVNGLQAMKSASHLDHLAALEISEFCPRKDDANHTTEQLIPQLIESCLAIK